MSAQSLVSRPRLARIATYVLLVVAVVLILNAQSGKGGSGADTNRDGKGGVKQRDLDRQVDPKEVEVRYGIPPALVPDFIALRGDPSDGIPGAKGVGEKTAAELLREHGSLEGVLDNAIGITRPKLRTALIEDRDAILAYRDIATLRDAGVKRPRSRKLNRRGAAGAARERGMNRLAERLESFGS